MNYFGQHNAVLTIDLGAIEKNYRLFQQVVGNNCAVAGVCKANAYGTGLKEITQKLTTLHCPQFFVANLDEALSIREHNQTTPVAMLGGLMLGEENTYSHHNISPVLNSPLDIENWQNHARTLKQELPAILHIDTAMNRLGLSLDEIQSVQGKLEGINLNHIMSHFACADEQDHELSALQHQRFKEALTHLPQTKISLANSSGLFRSKNYHYDMVRPGYALYGGNPTPETNNPMHRVITLESRILQVRECKKNESIGYGAPHKFSQNTRTATIALGYADGFFRNHGDKASVYFNNQPCPVIGRVSMDLVTIDVSQITGTPPQQGDAIEILGENQSVDDLATSANTIGYEILTSLGPRYKRIYKG